MTTTDGSRARRHRDRRRDSRPSCAAASRAFTARQGGRLASASSLVGDDPASEIYVRNKLKSAA